MLPSARLNRDADAGAAAGLAAKGGSAGATPPTATQSSLLSAIAIVDAELALSNKDAADCARFLPMLPAAGSLPATRSLDALIALIALPVVGFFAFATSPAGQNSLSLCGAPRRPPLEDS